MQKEKKNSLLNIAGVLTASNIIVQIVTLLSVMLLTRYLSKTEYGTYSQIMMIVQMCTAIFSLGMPDSLNYFVVNADDEEKTGKFISNYFTIITILSVIAGVVLAVCVPAFENYFHNPALKYFVYFLAILPWTRIVSTSVSNLLVVYKKAGMLMVYRFAHAILVVGSVAVVWKFSLGFKIYMIVYLAIEASFSLVVYFIASRLTGGLRFSFEKQQIYRLLTFSIPLGLSAASTTLKAETDKLIIGYFFSTEELAVFTNAAKELPVVIIATALTAAILPQTTRLIKGGKEHDAVELWKNTTSLSLIIHVFLAIGLFTFSREAVSLLYSEKYLEGAKVFAIYSLVYIVRSTYWGNILNAMGKTKYILYTEIILLAANAVLNIVFYYIWGFVGPAIATVAVSTLGAFIILKYTSKSIKIPIKDLFPWRDFGIILVTNIILGIMANILKQVLPIEQLIGEIGEAIVLAIIWGMIVLLIFRRKITQKIRYMKRY